jgi:hypothetical protein
MTPTAWLNEWSKVQLDNYQYQHELLVTGRMTTRGTLGAFSAVVDTTGETTELVKERIAELEKFFAES